MPVNYLLTNAWRWAAETGIPLVMIVVCALLVPRVGRFVARFFASRTVNPRDNPTEQQAKTRLALLGAGIYVAELVAFFFLTIFALRTIGFSPTGAAIPATVISAAVGLGSQSIIADFLAGFFILTEKQFGVGDWVRFRGSSVDVEGDVIKMTMRATTLRTLAGETVLIPNSTARVCINHSNHWARAVVVIPVPLLGSASVDEAIARSVKATQRALRRPETAVDVTGELEVHPSVGIEMPGTTGMPWSVDMRFIVQVRPARQWAVERAIRTRILEEFWLEYGSAVTASGVSRETVEFAPMSELTGNKPKHGRQLPYPTDDDHGAGRDPNRKHTLPAFSVPISPASAEEPQQPYAQGTTAADATAADPSDVAVNAVRAGSAIIGAHGESRTSGGSYEDHTPVHGDEETNKGLFRKLIYENKRGKIFSFGGRVRPSTTVLFLILFALLILRGMTVEPSEVSKGGVLAPPPPRPLIIAPKTTTPTVSPTPSPHPSTQPALPSVEQTPLETITTPKETTTAPTTTATKNPSTNTPSEQSPSVTTGTTDKKPAPDHQSVTTTTATTTQDQTSTPALTTTPETSSPTLVPDSPEPLPTSTSSNKPEEHNKPTETAAPPAAP